MIKDLENLETDDFDRDPEEEKIFQTFKAYFSCSICLNFITKPQMTPCGHLFCSECLNTWSQSIYPQIYCPKCRNPFKMGDTILMYLGQTVKSTKKFDLSIKKKLSYKNTNFNGSRVFNVLLCESRIDDSLSLKTLIFISIFFTVIFTLLFRLLG